MQEDIFECPACFHVEGIDSNSKQCPKCGCYFYTAQKVIDVQIRDPQHHSDSKNIFSNNNTNTGQILPKAIIKDYKGNPVICIPFNEFGSVFSFGLRKAQAILKHLDDIKRFVDEGEKEEAKKRKGLEHG